MELFDLIKSDLDAVMANDPAAKGRIDALINHTPFHAIACHRISHALHLAGVPILPRLLANILKVWSGVEMHPGAQIGKSFFIDHGAGVVIGETAQIGGNCVIFHNVTLGGTGKHRGKRHPTIGNGVLIGTGATLLGPIKVGDRAKIGAGTFIMMRDVPSDCTVVGSPGMIVKIKGKRVSMELPLTVIEGSTEQLDYSRLEL
ncbi:MAG TPA: serine acetyltransferase [Candidatus Diapherotrites archaeon]|uniref:serine O-acetyltransferase n=1 Tax=Candidatus Iainarchaeum sp. TaxID=3101447 RepID=A0A7J4IYH5_9ARCH|nr:serine acetyltransferase [Candidatus Diapherotrites archaeon]